MTTKNHFLISLLAIFSFTAHAQMDSCNIFFRGQYLQAGMAFNGSFGSNSTLPAGFYSNCKNYDTTCNCTIDTNMQVGFIADPDMDGWTVGSPAFYGDFFLPGSPFEGWAIQWDTTQCSAWQTDITCHSGYKDSGSKKLAGNTVSYATSGSKMVGTWEGAISDTSTGAVITISLVTTMDTLALYFVTKVTLTNTGSSPANNIYYMRSVDPDNDEADGGGFNTNNTIQYQYSDSAYASVVTAVGQTYSVAYIALGTTDSNSRVFIGEQWPNFSGFTIANYFDTVSGPVSTSSSTGYTNIYRQGATDNGDFAIGLVKYIPHLASVDSAADSVYRTTSAGMHPANQVTFSYFYSFSPAATDSAINYLNGGGSALSIKNVNVPVNSSVYPNPAQNELNVTNVSAGEQVMLYDLSGRLLRSWTTQNTGTNTYSISDLPAGCYVVNVLDNNGVLKNKVKVVKVD